MFLEPFEAPELKVERARYHFAAMVGTLLDYQSSASPAFIKTDRETNPWQIEIAEPVPKIVALQLGDIAHSLRSALDITMCDIARSREVGLCDMVYPFAIDQNRFEEMLAEPNRKQAFKKLGNDVVEAIIASKPYAGGNQILRGLHDLNNHDKHRMSVPYASFVSVTGTFHKMATESGIALTMFGGPLIGFDIGAPLNSENFLDDPANEYVFNKQSIVVTFPADYVLGGNVITTMGELIDHVEELIGRFRALAEA